MNPLLQETLRIPFPDVRPEHVEPAIQQLLIQCQAQLDSLLTTEEAPTFENFVRPLDEVTRPLDYAMGVVSHLEAVSTTPELRKAYNSVLPAVSRFRSELILNQRIWARLKTFADTPKAATLGPAERRYLDRTMTAFRNHGADLGETDKARLIQIDSELSEITTKFSQNVLDSLNAFEYRIEDEAELAGLPESARALGSSLAQSKQLTGWRFTLQQPSYVAILTYSDVRALREKFYRAYVNVAATGERANPPHIYRILELRREKAKLLGFADFSDFVLNERMAKSGATALNFLVELESKIRPFAERERQELEQFVASIEGADFRLEPWDVPYYAEKMRKKMYDFDEEAVRQYFPLPAVNKGIFSIFERVFGISIAEVSDFPVWAPDVKTYSVKDQDGSVLGYFYSDLFPRETKRGGAWMDSFLTSVINDQASPPHLGLIAGNFTPPQEGKPALLTHDEVNTLFHELGHLLHHLFTKVSLRGQSMGGVPWDFIEFPSQIMENWCYEREALDLFASHFETGARMPEELFSRIVRAQNFRRASFYLRQLSFGTLDLKLHREYNREKDGDILEYCREHLKAYSPAPLPQEYAWICSFTHVFGGAVGYAAGYYSYLWAEVIEADAFSRFHREGVLNRTTGLLLREKILSRGDSVDPSQMVRDFLGRDPQSDALLTRAGLT